MLKIQQRLKSERDNVFTEEINKIMQSADSINIYIWNKQRSSKGKRRD